MKNTQKIHVSSPDAPHRVDRSLIKSTAQLLLMRFLLPLLLLLGATLPAQASHFRYGTVSWEPTATTGQVKFTIVDAFRRSAYTGTASDGRPAIGNIITENTGATSFSFGDGGNTGTLQYIVTAIDTAEDFLIGEALNPGTSNRGVLHTYSGAGPFTAQISSAARISALNNRSGGSYVLTTTVRPLSGNSSPKSSLSPVVVVPQLATASFLVPGADANGDGLRWRLSTDAEAGGGASPSNLSVNANTGLVTWNNVGLNTTNPWTVQIIIEDLDTSGNVKSQTPVDFLMEIDPNAAGNPPVVTINPSGPVTILPGNPVSFSVSSTDPDASSTVSLNASGLPGGSTMTPTLPVSGSGATGVNSTFNWTPSASQTGSFPIVFTATDNTGRQTSASKTITVSTATPPAVAGGAAPTTTFTTAMINASVNPNGTPTSVRFEYGTSTSYGNSTTPQSIGNGTSPVAVSANLNGLLSGTTYNFRLVASNAGGTTNGPNQTFTTDRARLTAVAISSNGTNGAYARIGQTLSLSFTANTPIQTPAVTIAGKAASVSGAGTSWSATVTVDATYNEGVAPFSIVFNDAAGNPGLTTTATTNGSSVTIDRTAPVLTVPPTQNVSVNTANGAQAIYAPATATDLTPVTIVYSRPSGSIFQIGQTTVTVTATDAAGNVSTGSFLVVATLQIVTPPLTPGGSAPFVSGTPLQDTVASTPVVLPSPNTTRSSLQLQNGGVLTMFAGDVLTVPNGLFIDVGGVLQGSGTIVGDVFNSGVIDILLGSRIMRVTPVTPGFPSAPGNGGGGWVLNYGQANIGGGLSGGGGGGGGYGWEGIYNPGIITMVPPTVVPPGTYPTVTLPGDFRNVSGQVRMFNGLVTITGRFTQTGTGKVLFHLRGITQSLDYSYLHIGGAAQLEGSFDVDLVENYQPAFGSTYDIFVADGGVTYGPGGFTVNLPPDFSWQLLPDNKTIRLTYNGLGTGPGAIDPSFAMTGKGILLGTAVQPDGRVLAGGTFGFFGPVNGQTVGDTLRFNGDGTLDGAFSPAGTAWDILVQPDGKVVLGDNGSGISVRWVNADGTPDAGFVPAVQIRPAAIQNDGKIVGWNSNGVVRLNANGSLDATFPVSGFTVAGVALQTDGKYVVSANDASSAGRVIRLNANGTLDGSFAAADFSGIGFLRVLALQGDGKIVVAGFFSAVNGVTRNNVARLNANGTLDAGFNPNVPLGPFNQEGVRSMVAQADGKVLIGGQITHVGGVPVSGLVRLHADGTLDTSFTTASGLAVAPVIQADGRIVYGLDPAGNFLNDPLLRRVFNDPAVQVLTTPNRGTVLWQRGGSAPETQQVSFELTTNGGNAWTPLGFGSRVTGGWQLTGLSLPATGQVRARARTVSGEFASSTGIVEQVAAISFTGGGNTTPLAVADTFTIPIGATVELDVLSNDSDADSDPLTITSVTDRVGCDARASAGNTKVIMTPDRRLVTPSSFKYTVTDGQGGVATATVTVTQQSIVPLILAGRPAASWAALALSSGATVSDTAVNSQTVVGDVGIYAGSMQTLATARVVGDLYIRTTSGFIRGGISALTGTTYRSVPTDQFLGDSSQAARDASSTAGGLLATPGYPSTVTAGTTLSATGTVAINLTDLVLGAGQVLLLNGNAGTRYIINVSNRMALTGGTVQVGAGLPPENVLVHLGTPGTAVTLGSNARFTGTLLAPYRAITVNTGAQVTGGAIGASINVFSGGKLRRGP